MKRRWFQNWLKFIRLNQTAFFLIPLIFFTFIDSTNEHCELPQRGKNKQKRYDLRQIGMALLVTREEQFPLFHKTYKGNQADSPVFKESLEEIFNRLREVVGGLSDVTLVFDKGNNSKENFSQLDNAECHYVGD